MELNKVIDLEALAASGFPEGNWVLGKRWSLEAWFWHWNLQRM